MDPLPDHIADLIRAGRKIEAIKLIREETGVGLKEAKEAVDRLAAGMEPLLAPSPAVASNALPAEVEALARAGKRIEAIKRLRDQTGMGLKEAKEQVEAVAGPTRSGCGPALSLIIAVLLLLLGAALAVFFSAAG